MYGVNNSGNFFARELTKYLFEAGFFQSQRQMSIYYKYEPDETKIVVLSYVDNFLFWYTSEDFRKWFVDALGNRLHVKYLGYAHWFMSIIISHMRYHSIYVYKARYATSFVAKYLDTDTINTSAKFYKTTLPSDMIFTKADASTSYEQVEKLTREFNIHYRPCIVSLIYLLSTRVDLSFSVQQLAKF